jgi:phosphoglycolate phosphatase
MTGWRNVLFDLDGTLIDSRPGIFGGLRHALQQMGYELPTGDLDWAIGPPLVQVLARLLAPFGDARAEEAARHYRAWYGQVGLFDARPYPGVPELIDHLAHRERSLFVATSKRTDFARRVLDHFGLSRCFRAIQGSESHGQLDAKAALFAHVLKRESLAAEETVVVGDREHDVIGARANGLSVIAVTYGYGGGEELRLAGAERFADSPEQIGQLLE